MSRRHAHHRLQGLTLAQVAEELNWPEPELGKYVAGFERERPGFRLADNSYDAKWLVGFGLYIARHAPALDPDDRAGLALMLQRGRSTL